MNLIVVSQIPLSIDQSNFEYRIVRRKKIQKKKRNTKKMLENNLETKITEIQNLKCLYFITQKYLQYRMKLHNKYIN